MHTVLSSKNIKIHKINELKHRDLALGLIKLEGKSTVIASVYMDITTPIEPIITPVLDYCQRHGYGILIGSDTNAHHTDWGLEINDRGRQLEEIIDNYGLVVHNRGRLPTYECKLGSSIIDVTLSSRLPLKLENWRVNRSFNGSDHNTIHYQLVTDTIEIPSHRDYATADWNSFTHELSTTQTYVPSHITQKKLDKMVQKLTYSIENATENSCPTIPKKTVNKNIPWWNPLLADTRKELNALHRKHQNTPKYTK